MIEFLALLIAVVVWAVVGHGLWTIGAAVIRSVFGQPAAKSIEKLTATQPTPESDLKLADEALDRLTRGRVLDSAGYSTIRNLLEEVATAQNVTLTNRLNPDSVSEISDSGNRLSFSTLPPGAQTTQASLPPVVVGREIRESSSADLVAAAGQLTETRAPSQVHALDREYAQQPPSAMSQIAGSSKRAMGAMLQEFLNEKNIHWGELLSGILIVGSASGLILSLRKQLDDIIPMFPAVMFLLVTAAVHYAGFYTLSRWKLPSTSRGILLIGSLLVPITGLAASLLADRQTSASVLDPTFLTVLVVGGGICCALTYYAGKQLFAQQPATWMAAIMGAAISQGFVNRLADGASSLQLSVLGILIQTGLAYVAVRIALLPRIREMISQQAPASQALPLLSKYKLFGVTAFSLLVATCLLLFRSREQASMFPLAVPLAVLGLMISSIGGNLKLNRKAPGNSGDSYQPDWPQADEWMGLVSSATCLLGGAISLAAILLARDDVLCMVAVAFLVAMGTAALAALFDQIALTAVSLLASSFGVVLFSHFVTGNISGRILSFAMLEEILHHGLTAFVLLGLGLAHTGLAWWLVVNRRQGENQRVSFFTAPKFDFASSARLVHWSVVLVSAGIHVLAAVLIATVVVFSAEALDSVAVGLVVLVIGALATLVAGRASDHSVVSWLGSGIVLLCCIAIVRPESPLLVWLGLAGWSTTWKLSLVLLVHSVCVAVLDRLLVLLLPKPTALNNAAAMSSVLTAIAAIPLALKWHEPSYLMYQAACLSISAAICIGQSALLGKNFLGLIGQAAAGIALGQILAVVFASLLQGMSSIDVWLVFMCSLVSLGMCMLASFPLRGTRSRLIPDWNSRFADALCILFVVYTLILTARSVVGHGPLIDFETFILAIGICVVAGATIVLAGVRNRQLHQFSAGVTIAFGALVIPELFASGSWRFTSRWILVGMSPMLIALGFAAFDLFYVWRRTLREGSMPAQQRGPFEEFVSWGTLVVWAAITGFAYVSGPVVNSQSLLTLANAMGLIWLILGLVTYTLQFPLSATSVGSLRIYVASLLLVVQLPLVVHFSAFNSGQFRLEFAFLLACVGGHATMAAGLMKFVGQALKPTNAMTSHTSLLSQPNVLARYQAAASFTNELISYSATAVGVISVIVALVCIEAHVLSILAVALFLAAVALTVANSGASHAGTSSTLRLSVAIAIYCLFGIAVAWCNLPSSGTRELVTSRLLTSASVMYIAAIAMSIVHSRVSGTQSIWLEPIRQTWWPAVACSMACSALATIAVWQNARHYPGLAVEAALQALLQVFAIAILLLQAVKETWNVGQLPGKMKSAYVYLAETLAIIMALGLYVAFPQFFVLPLREYWPLTVLVLALITSGISRWLTLRGVEVIGDPIARTSSALPLVAGFGGLIVGSTASPELVFSLGTIFYFVLGAVDGSRRMAILGAVFANITLWFFWHDVSLDFVRHPQLWLIPPAASVLTATHFHRGDLARPTLVWIRYVCLGLIFLSSTSEIVTAFGRNLLPPMILMVVSVLAALTGISLRIRSFLYFGTIFLLVAITAMVAHAQQSLGHTWPWWALGISLGTAILVLFGLFEKKRDELKRWSDKLRTWHD